MQLANANPSRGSQQGDFRLAAKTALLERGLSVTLLSQMLGRARNTVSLAINQPAMMAGVKAEIARALGLDFFGRPQAKKTEKKNKKKNR